MELRRITGALRALVVMGVMGGAVLLAPAAAQASVSVQVTSTAGTASPPSQIYVPETLADAVAYVQSNGGGTITFAPSLTGQTITLTSSLADITAATTITGPSSGTVTISGAGTRQIFDVSSTGSLALSDLTLTDGYDSTDGGAISTAGPLTLDGVTLTANSALGGGGAICSCSGVAPVTIDDSTITGNSAVDAGGGIASVGGSLTIEYSTISQNSAGSGAGGGIYGVGMSIEWSTVAGNSAAVGAGIFSAGDLTVSDSTLTGNDASQAGGAIMQGDGGTAAPLNVASSTIVGNIASGTSTTSAAGGGGIWADASKALEPVSLLDTVVAGNTADQGDPDVFSDGSVPQTSANFSLIGDSAGDGITSSTATDIIGSSSSPVNPLLGALASNGGPTQTMLPLAGSPVIDAGVDADGMSIDQREKPRTVKLGFPEPAGGDGTDIGAVELQDTEIAGPTVTAISPGQGAAGTALTITGTNLFLATEVEFGSTFVTAITAVSDTEITVPVPPGLGTVDVRVITPAGLSAESAADEFTYPVSTQLAVFGNQELVLTAPNVTACLAPKTKLHATFATAAIKGSRKTKVKFKSAAFYIDKGVKHKRKKKPHVTTYTANATSRKTPVSENLSLKGLKSGSHTLKVIATYTERAGHPKKTRSVTETLLRKFKVC
jgi:IPT/TIG domain